MTEKTKASGGYEIVELRVPSIKVAPGKTVPTEEIGEIVVKAIPANEETKTQIREMAVRQA